MNAVDTFRSKSSGIVARLLGDFPIQPEPTFGGLLDPPPPSGAGNVGR